MEKDEKIREWCIAMAANLNPWDDDCVHIESKPNIFQVTAMASLLERYIKAGKWPIPDKKN